MCPNVSHKQTAVIKPLPHTQVTPTTETNMVHAQGRLCKFRT